MALTRFAGTFNAIDFAYGVQGSNVPPLQVTLGSTSTGAYTITCSPNAVYTPAGLSIPISAATPINVGGGSNQDINITPTTVSQSGQNSLLITATFTYAHGPGAQVSSGTYGLAEAALAASKYGGGSVAVDARWFQLGGTQAIIDAVTEYAGVEIVNNSGSATGTDIVATTIVIPNASVLTLNTVPYQLLPNLDTNSMYYVSEAVFVNKNAGVAYTGGGVITVGYGTTTSTTQALTTTVAASFLTSPTVGHVTTLAGAQTADTTLSTYTGKGVWISAATANFAAGTGTLEVTLTYMKLST
jgi:hypothetical protein